MYYSRYGTRNSRVYREYARFEKCKKKKTEKKEKKEKLPSRFEFNNSWRLSNVYAFVRDLKRLRNSVNLSS